MRQFQHNSSFTRGIPGREEPLYELVIEKLPEAEHSFGERITIEIGMEENGFGLDGVALLCAAVHILSMINGYSRARVTQYHTIRVSY